MQDAGLVDQCAGEGSVRKALQAQLVPFSSGSDPVSQKRLCRRRLVVIAEEAHFIPHAAGAELRSQAGGVSPLAIGDLSPERLEAEAVNLIAYGDYITMRVNEDRAGFAIH